MPWGAVAGAAISTIGGALLGGDNEQQQQTVTTNAPWTGQQSYLTDIFGRAQSQANQGAYSGPYIAPESKYTAQARDRLASASNADPYGRLMGDASGELGKTIRGDYLDPATNPYLPEAFNQVRRQMSGQFSGDSFNSSANQEWLGRNLVSAATPILMQERQNQLNALKLAPEFRAADLQNTAGRIGLLSTAGASGDTRAEAERAAAEREFYAPWDPLNRYANLIGAPIAGNTVSTTTADLYRNPINDAIGGALAGYQLYKNIGGNNTTGGGNQQSFPTVGGDPYGVYDGGFGYGAGNSLFGP